MPNEELASACSEIPASHAAGDQAALEQESHTSGFGQCEWTDSYRDYDGVMAEVPCLRVAVVQVPVDEPDGSRYIVQLCTEHQGYPGWERGSDE